MGGFAAAVEECLLRPRVEASSLQRTLSRRGGFDAGFGRGARDLGVPHWLALITRTM